jgi:Ankyrin repeats (many copies)
MSAGKDIEAHYDKWRARLRFSDDGVRISVRGPHRNCRAAADRDLAILLRARRGAGLGRRAAYEATRAAADDMPNQGAEVEALARRVGEAMQNGDRRAALELTAEWLHHPASLDTRWLGGGTTLLAAAARWSCKDAAALLLEHGADANVSCELGLVPIHLASQCGNVSLMHELLLWGADPNRQDGEGFTALQMATLTAPSADVADARELLMVCGARETATDRRDFHRRLAADKNDRAYLAHFRGDLHAGPACGVAAAGI